MYIPRNTVNWFIFYLASLGLLEMSVPDKIPVKLMTDLKNRHKQFYVYRVVETKNVDCHRFHWYATVLIKLLCTEYTPQVNTFHVRYDMYDWRIQSFADRSEEFWFKRSRNSEMYGKATGPGLEKNTCSLKMEDNLLLLNCIYESLIYWPVMMNEHEL